MLYDNALLAVAYLEGYQASGREDFARVVREILRYVERDMTSPEGGFYSATDADSLTPAGEREEGGGSSPGRRRRSRPSWGRTAPASPLRTTA